jgi:hypothetical protein
MFENAPDELISRVAQLAVEFQIHLAELLPRGAPTLSGILRD